MTGNASTPFLLARVSELTGGASLTASILSSVLSLCGYGDTLLPINH